MHIYLANDGKVAAEESVNAAERLIDALFKSLLDEEIKQMLVITAKLYESLDSFDSDDHIHRTHHEHHHGFDKKEDVIIATAIVIISNDNIFHGESGLSL